MFLEYFNVEKFNNPNSFCNSSFTWKDLCGIRTSKEQVTSREHQNELTNIYYWIERITFELLVLNKEEITKSKMSVDEVCNLFLEQKNFYHDILYEQIVELKEDSLDFKTEVCIRCIFSNIKNDKRLWLQVKKEHDSFMLKNNLEIRLDSKANAKKTTKC